LAIGLLVFGAIVAIVGIAATNSPFWLHTPALEYCQRPDYVPPYFDGAFGRIAEHVFERPMIGFSCIYPMANGRIVIVDHMIMWPLVTTSIGGGLLLSALVTWVLGRDLKKS
jgi:hypothetical protein